jgi:integrase
LSSVTLAELEAYLANLRGSARTRKGRADYLRTLFRFALRRGMIGRDVSAGLEAVTVPPSAPSLHTPEEVEAVLRAAEAHGSRRLVVNLALRYFAGLRAAEVARLGPEDVDLARGWVTVPAIKAKTRSRRLVRIQPALRSFLEAGPLELPGATMEQSLWELTKARGLRWPRNVARHSWVSYRLAASGSAAETAMEAGHSEVMLFRNYRELTSPEEAAKFWALRASDSPPAL